MNEFNLEALLDDALKKAGSRTKLARDLNIRISTACLWYKGVLPNYENLIKLCEYNNKTLVLKKNRSDHAD